MESGIQQRTTAPPPAAPVPLLPHLSQEDVLPDLGGWSQHLGRRVLLASTAVALALASWPWRQTVQAQGVIRPAGENTVVQSSLDGIVAVVWVRENQRVRRGERLAELDRRSLQEEQRKLEAELRSSLDQERDSLSQSGDLHQQQQAALALSEAQQRSRESDAADARATLRLRESEVRRYRVLLDSGAVAAGVVEEKQAQLQLASNSLMRAQQALQEQHARSKAELARLRQGDSQTISQRRELGKLLEQTRTRLAAVKRSLANSVITAPTAGIVIATGLRHAQQVIRAGEVLAQIAPEDGELRVKAVVPSRDVGSIRAGQQADLRIAGCPYPDFGVMRARVLSLSADRVEEVSQSGSASGFVVTLAPAGRLLRAGERLCNLRHGMEVRADITTQDTTILRLLLTRLRLMSGG